MQIVFLLAYLLVLSVQPINAQFCPHGGDIECSCHGNYVPGNGNCNCFDNPWNGNLCLQCDDGKFTFVTKQDEKCAGHGGSATFTVTNTRWTPAVISLDGNDNSFPKSPTLTYTNLPPDSYTVDAFGTVGSEFCEIWYTFTPDYTLDILAAPAISASASAQEGECTSSFSITAHGGNGGVGSFKYSIDGTTYQDSNTFSNLPPATYTYYIKDTSVTEFDCVKSFNITLTTTSLAPTPACAATQPKCWGDLGQVTISASGGSLSYTYSLDGVTYNSTNTYWEPANSNQTCYVKDSSCTSFVHATVPSAPAQIVVAATTVNATCQGANDGSVSFSGSGGTGSLEFSLDGQVWDFSFSGLGVGTHQFYVRDQNNCSTPDANYFEIKATHGIVPLVTIKNDSCTGTPSGSISFNVSTGSTNQLLLSFNGSVYENNTWKFTGLAPGNYNYSIMDQNHCTVGDVLTVHQTTRAPCSKGICGANSICNDSSCGYVCSCSPGYFKNGTVCQDIDECAVDNGACDYRTVCTNTPGSHTCSPCPDGTIPSGNVCNGHTCSPLSRWHNSVGKCVQWSRCRPCTDGAIPPRNVCNVTCGNGKCEEFENCVNCFTDCNTTTCNMCDDGYCDPTIHETCTTCFDDCGPCGQQTCEGGCGTHGTCVAGVCKCDSSWSGPTCSTPNQAFNATYNETGPSASININFLVSLKSISEINPSGTVLRSYSLSAINFTRHTNSSGLNTIYNYSTVLPNRAPMSVILQQFEENATIVSFAGMNSTFSAHTLKLNVIIRQWPFLALANSLSLTIDALALQNNTSSSSSCVSDNQDDSGSLRWVLIVEGNTSLYGQFEDKAEVDGRVRVVDYHLNPDKTISAILPNFWEYANMDPSFSVLVGDETSSKCGKSKSTKGVNKKLIEIIVPVVVGAAILTALVIALFPKVKTWWQLNHTKSAYELEADDFKTEYRPDMRTQNEAGDFRVKF